MNINTELFRLINGLAHKNIFLDQAMIAFTKYVPLIFMGVLAVLYLYGVFKRDSKIRCIAVNTFFITVINLFISYGIGLIYYVPRPFVRGKVNLLIPHVVDASFPSDHAMGTMSIALGVNKFSRLYGRIMIILSCIVGFSRVYVGHHYPFDVIGGFLIVVLVNYAYSHLLQGRVADIYIKIESALIKYVPVRN